MKGQAQKRGEDEKNKGKNYEYLNNHSYRRRRLKKIR
jgi:hypothetical protein